MTPEQIILVRATFARARRVGPQFSATFYSELFAIDPMLRPMFSGDMIRQGEQLMAFLGYIADGMDQFETMLAEVKALALRHVGYGVEERHYAAVRVALLRTLRHEIGADFSQQAREAWTAAYNVLSDAMIEAAYRARPSVSANPAASLQR